MNILPRKAAWQQARKWGGKALKTSGIALSMFVIGGLCLFVLFGLRPKINVLELPPDPNAKDPHRIEL